MQAAHADAYFDLLFDNELMAGNDFIAEKPVFVNAVTCTAKEIGHSNYIRLNAWPGFLQRPVMEMAAMNEGAKAGAEKILHALGWQYIWAPDEPGMVTARVISMIINEAYFGLADGISTRHEIDIAMKLGTNYPYGPFEWAQKIGLQNIYFLLKKLQEQYGNRYAAAGMLEQEVKKNGLIT
jgi:3-hydroxybutyryl-CoA dehydrogenase